MPTVQGTQDILRVSYVTRPPYLAVPWTVSFCQPWVSTCGTEGVMVMCGDETEEPILFRETDASGRSLKSWVTKYGGATGCLVITVTQNELCTTLSLSFLPQFSLIPKRLRLYQEQALTKQSDLSHRIPKADIISVVMKSKWWWRKTYEVSYRDEAGVVNRLELIPKKCDDFERALRLPITAI